MAEKYLWFLAAIRHDNAFNCVVITVANASLLSSQLSSHWQSALFCRWHSPDAHAVIYYFVYAQHVIGHICTWNEALLLLLFINSLKAWSIQIN